MNTISREHEGLHFGLGDTPLIVSLLASAEACHQDTLGTTACRDTSGASRCMEQGENHGNDLGLHLPDTREYIRMYRVRDGELSIGLGLEGEELVLAVVDGA